MKINTYSFIRCFPYTRTAVSTIILFFITLFCHAQEARLVLPIGHTNIIYTADYSPDGKYIATVSADGSVKLYETSGGKELRTFTGHTRGINSISFSPDGKLIATAADDNTARIYEVSSGKELHVLTKKTEWEVIHMASFSPDGKLLAVAADDKTTRIYDVASGKELKVIGYTGSFLFANFSPDGKQIAACSGNIVKIYETSSGKDLQVLSGHSATVYSASFSPDGKYVLTNSMDNTARIFDLSTGKKLHILFGHKNHVRTATFSPDGKYVLTASHDSTARIYDVSTGKTVHVLSGHKEELHSGSFSPDGKYALTASNDSTARIYDVSTGKTVHVLRGHSGRVRFAAFSPDGKYVLTTSNDQTGRIYETASGICVQILSGYSNSARLTAVSPDNKYGLAVYEDSTAIIYEVSSGMQKDTLTGHSIRSIVFSPDSELILTASYDNKVRIYEAASGKLLQVLSGHTSLVKSAIFSPDGKYALTASDDNTARIYEVSSGRELKVFSESKWIYTASFSPNGKYVATASQSNDVRIYEVASGNELKVLSGHTEWVYNATFSSDSKLLVTASADNTSRVFDVESGKELKVLAGHKLGVNTASFSPDGKFIVSSSWHDKSARIYEVSSSKELHLLSGHLGFVESAVFSPDGKFVISKDRQNITIVWDVATGKMKHTYVLLKNYEWLVYDEHYRFDGSQAARDYLYFVCGLEVVDLAQVKDALYVPNLTQRIMNGENLDHLPKLKDLEICGVSPEVKPDENKKDGGYHYQITPQKGGIGKVEIFINGMLRQTLEGAALPQKNGIYELLVDKKLVEQHEIANLETEIKVIARTSDNSIGSRGAIAKQVSKKVAKYGKPHLYAIMIGIDDYKGEGLDLNFAAKDATDMQKALESAAKKLFNQDDTNRVHFYNLTVDRGKKIGGKTPDRNNILQVLEKIEKESKPEDVFLFFFAGHGDINPNKQFLLLTAEASQEEAPNYSGISMKELLEKLAKIPAGKRILLLDACHSGAAINELNMKDLAGARSGESAEKQSQRLKELENLASKSGLAIITASSSEQKALELPQYEHGLMTYALLTTMLNDPAALDKDNNLQLEDWLRETERAVGNLMENQSAQRFVPLNFSIGKVDESVRKSIVLREIPTVVVANVLNRNTDDDDLDIKSQLKKLLSEVATRGNDKILLADKESNSSFSVNLSYEIASDKIESRITLKKNKAVVKQFNFTGKAADVPGFVKGLSEEILKNVKN